MRIAWLLTHASLRSAEAPILRSLDCEVWTQKAFPALSGYRSCHADFSWDGHLSIPAEELELLNAFDFYTSPITPKISKVLNDRFDLVAVDGNSPLKTREILAHFQGPILFRAFGMEDPNSYTQVHFNNPCPGLHRALVNAYHRFWFGAFYPEVIPNEHEVFRRRSFHLPIPLPHGAWKNENQWTGTEKTILFVCPTIHESVACKAIYDDFKHHFGDLPHAIAGKQITPVNDPHVTGFLDAASYARLFLGARAMYYHSREPRHLHYHPVEAMATGMPVVYLKGGLLERYDQGSQAGACATEAEARAKLIRLLNGDDPLAEAIRASQQTVVAQWRPEVARAAWADWFDLFTPLPDGTRPGLDRWSADFPVPTRADLRDYPFLNPRAFVPSLTAARMWRSARRYFAAAISQKTLLPTGVYRVDRFRNTMARLWGRTPPSSENPGGNGS
jgi:hypothetical protein